MFDLSDLDDDQDAFHPLLRPHGTVRVDPATSKEAVSHHALAKQKSEEYEDDYKHEQSNYRPGWPSSCIGRRTRSR